MTSETELTKEVFNNFKEAFIEAYFQDNIYFQQFLKDLIKVKNPSPPKLDIWTQQPITTIKK
jgi:hypothetical protein